MFCRNCGEFARRSRSRNLLEFFIRTLTPFRTYRCDVCGWRGFQARKPTSKRFNPKRIAMVWITLVILALGVGGFGAAQMQSSLARLVVRR
jgi:hypothetical protein